jgi:methionyl-tRNA formyltransferase
MKVVFFGSGPFANSALEALVAQHERYPLVRVYTRPDRPGRRGRKLLPTPVKTRAAELDVDCRSPESVNDPATLDEIRALEADLFVVADYGEILRQPFLDTPPIGTFNLHGSILPKYRGAAPVAHAILHGETESGVTLFRIERALDSGPIVAIAKTDILPHENAGELEARLATLSGELLSAQLPCFADGSFTETPQDHEQSTLAPKLAKNDGLIDFQQSAEEIHAVVRAMSPWPSAHAFLARGDKSPERTTLVRVEPAPTDEEECDAVPGSAVGITKNEFRIACGEGSLRVLEIQREGKAAMETAAYLRGRQLTPDDRFVGKGASSARNESSVNEEEQRA